MTMSDTRALQNSKAKLVSIGIPAFNARETIECAVRSALRQTWRPIEIVVVDDCSEDDTVSVLDGLARCHPEMRVVRHTENRGVAASRNSILETAQGEFIAFFDDDDESCPDRVTLQIRRIIDYERDYPDAVERVICHSARRVIYPDDTVRIEPTMGQRTDRAAPAGRAVAERILFGSPLKDGYGACPTCSQMARAATYRALGGFDTRFRRSEDTEFNVRLARAGGHFVGVATPLVEQRMTLTSEKSLADEFKFAIEVLEKHRDVAATPAQYEFARRWLSMRHRWLCGRKGEGLACLIRLALRHPLLTINRLLPAIGMIGTNLAFARFHRQGRDS